MIDTLIAGVAISRNGGSSPWDVAFSLHCQRKDREQVGVQTFETIETIRRLSTAFEHEADPEAGRELDRLLAG